MKTPETPKGSLENTNEEPRSYAQVVERAKLAGDTLKELKEAGDATAEQLHKAERMAAMWLNKAMAAKLAGTISSPEKKPPAYEMTS